MAVLSQAACHELVETVKALTKAGKGILAADESIGTMQKRFDAIEVENTEENRGKFRSLLFTTPKLGDMISGAILYQETLYQTATDGRRMVDLLRENNIVPGIKVDKGVVSIMGTDDEKATTGLDGLAKRCAEYYHHGARFAKWRAVLSVDSVRGKPSPLSVQETAHTLARYASICQEHRLVPIVEPEILSDGSHDIQTCAQVTEEVLSAVFRALQQHHVLLEGALLKPNMVTAGSDFVSSNALAINPEEVAFYTVRTLRRTVPPALGGVAFLSGGQSEEMASVNLNAINRIPNSPWPLTFSYGRALQSSVLNAWRGKADAVVTAQSALLERAKANSEAQQGLYQGGAGGAAAATDLFEKKYTY